MFVGIAIALALLTGLLPGAAGRALSAELRVRADKAGCRGTRRNGVRA